MTTWPCLKYIDRVSSHLAFMCIKRTLVHCFYYYYYIISS